MDNRAAWMDSSSGQPLSPMRLLHPALSAEHGARSVGLTTYPSKLLPGRCAPQLGLSRWCWGGGVLRSVLAHSRCCVRALSTLCTGVPVATARAARPARGCSVPWQRATWPLLLQPGLPARPRRRVCGHDRMHPTSCSRLPLKQDALSPSLHAARIHMPC